MSYQNTIVDRHDVVVHRCASDAEAVRWWQANGQEGDRLRETGELLAHLEQQLGLER